LLKVSKDINRELETIVMSPLQEMPWAEAVAEMPCPRRVDDSFGDYTSLHVLGIISPSKNGESRFSPTRIKWNDRGI